MSEEEAPSQDAANATSQTPPPHRPKGTFLPLVFGGAVAAGLGFAAGELDKVEAWLGQTPASEEAALSEKLVEMDATLTAKVSAVDARIDAIPAPDLSGVQTQIGDLSAQFGSQSEALSALTARLEALEKRPMTEGLAPEAVAAYEAELARLMDDVNAQKDENARQVEDKLAEITAILDNAKASEAKAADEAQAALARAAVTQLIVAVDSGAPFSDALTQLADAGVTPDAALQNAAASGVPTLSALQEQFPTAARAALADARAAGEGGEAGSGLGGFLTRQLGARSVVPRDGTSADAILSRAEAAVKENRLSDALSEIDTLPQTAQSALSDWRTAAQTRADAQGAAHQLLTSLGAK